LIGKITKHGKRAKAEKIVFSCLAEINQICRGYPQIIFYEVLNKLKPTLTIVVKRKGRRFYQVPVPVKTIRQYIMALN
jgi:small subunit ribosomal protein S7